MSGKPKKRFSFKSLGFHFKHGSTSRTSLVEQPPLQRSVSEPPEMPHIEQPRLTTRSLIPGELQVPAQPARSLSDDAVAARSEPRGLASVESPPSAFRLPTPETSESGSDGELPRPGAPTGLGDDHKMSFPEPIQMPTPILSAEPSPAPYVTFALATPQAQPVAEPTLALDRHTAPAPAPDGDASPVAAKAGKGADVLEDLTLVAQRIQAGEPSARDGGVAAKALEVVGMYFLSPVPLNSSAYNDIRVSSGHSQWHCQ